MADQIVMYFFKLRSEVTGKWVKTRWRMTIEEARTRYGEGNFEVLWETKEVLEGSDHPGANSAAHLYHK